MRDNRFRIGTRGSRLAIAQAKLVADFLNVDAGVESELVQFVTRGDRASGQLAQIGGKGLFTDELEQALRQGAIDLAVHSAKDLPAIIAPDAIIVAVPRREDPRDAIISPNGRSIETLPPAATVGTSSHRRSSQALAIRNDLNILPLRGNVDTRIDKVLRERSLDSAILAMAGLKRAGLYEPHSSHITPLDIDGFIPSAGQGALALQAWKGNGRAIELAGRLDHESSHQALDAERSVLVGMNADCRSSIAVHVTQLDAQWVARAMVARPDASAMIRRTVTASSAVTAAEDLLKMLVRSGARELLA